MIKKRGDGKAKEATQNTNEEQEVRGFSNRHTWAMIDKETGTALIGITDYLAEKLGSIVSMDLPMEHDEVDIDTYCFHLHASKRIHHLRSPLSGSVVEINEDVLNNPNLLHIDPYENWLFRLEYDDEDEFDMLMDQARYQRFLDQL